MAEKIFSLIVGLFVTAIVARYFGPDEYGLLNQSLALVTLLSALSLLGLDHILVKKISNNQNNNEENEIILNALLLRLIGGVLMLFIISFFIILFKGTIIQQIDITYVFVFMYIFKSFEVYEYWFHSKQKMFSITFFRIISYSMSAAFKVSVVYFDSSLFIFSLAYLIDPLVYSILIYLKFNKTFKKDNITRRARFNYTIFKDLINESKPLLLSGILIGIYSKIDLVMLGSLSSNKEEVGYYAAALQISSMWYFVPFAIITANKSLIMKPDGFKYVVKVLEYLIVIGIAAGIFINLTSSLIIGILFGAEFSGAIIPLNILAWVGFFATIGTLRNVFFISAGNSKDNLFFTFLVVISNIVLNLILIPKYDALGASVASLLSQFLSIIIFPIVFKKAKGFATALRIALTFKNSLKLITTKMKGG